MGLPNILTFDMGGTTTKAAVIEKGEPHKSSEYEIGAPISRGSRLLKGGGYLLMVRAVDVAPTVLALLGLSVPGWMEGAPIAEMIPSRVRAGGAAVGGSMR